MSSSPSVKFIRTHSEFIEILPGLASARELSLDTEFHTERSYHPKLMLLQLRADEGEIYLIDTLEVTDISPLKPILESVPLLVHGGQSDLQILQRLTGAVPKLVFDTQVGAAFLGQGYPTRLLDLVQKNIGESIDKTWTLSDWSKRPLAPEQLRYAADDVWVLPPLARVLRRQLEESGRLGWCVQAAASVVNVALRPEEPDQLWRQIPGHQGLDAAGLGALRVLAKWRDKTARERDLPRNYLLTDALLLDTARRRPTNMVTLLANRRFPAQIAKRDGADILALLQQSSPMENPFPPRLVSELIRLAARVAEQQSGIAAELLLPEPVLLRLSVAMEMVKNKEISVEDAISRHLELWRQEALGIFFRDFLEGNTQIRMSSY